MLIPETTFPYAPLDKAQENKLLMYWGSVPIIEKSPTQEIVVWEDSPIEKEYIREFLEVSGKPLVREHPLFRYIKWIRVRTTDIEGANTIEGHKSFNAGMLLYAATLREVSGIDKLSVENDAIRYVYDQTAQDFYEESEEEGKKIPSYTALLEKVEPYILPGESPVARKLALAGAGAIHILVKRSVESPTNPEAMANNYPELADLEQIFNEGFGS